MATSPLPENPKNQTVANLDAWKKAGASIEVTSNSPVLCPVKNIRENEMPSKVGSISFSAKDAFKSSLAVNEEYSPEELNTVVDRIILHIKEMAEYGEMTANIDTSKFNNGLLRGLTAELKHRGFKVSRVRDESAFGLAVSWERRVDWKHICACILLLVILISVPLGYYMMSKSNQPISTQIEKSK